MADGKNIDGVSDADLAEAIRSPASFSVEGLSQSNRSVRELIEADQYLRGRALVSSRRRHPLSGLISHAIPVGPCDRF